MGGEFKLHGVVIESLNRVGEDLTHFSIKNEVTDKSDEPPSNGDEDEANKWACALDKWACDFGEHLEMMMIFNYNLLKGILI